MTIAANAASPLTLADWEAVLVDRFLRVGADGNSSPIRSFELTSETLALATGLEASDPGQAEAAFKAALLADRDLWRALRTGRHPISTAELPNCFAYLAMTLLIDTQMDGAYADHGQFRERLRSWLGTNRGLMQLSGVAVMWRSLSKWLDARVDAGDSVRRLILPSPGPWRQIGYTRRLSFPSRADVRFLDRVMASFRGDASSPPALIRAIGTAVDRGGASHGMVDALTEFRGAFRAGAASTDHRFWRLVLRAKKHLRNELAPEIILEFGFDEDGRRYLSLGQRDGEAAIESIENLGATMRSRAVAKSANLAAAATRGVLFFHQVGMARWRGASEPPFRAGAHVALSSHRANDAALASITLLRVGDWLLTTEPMGRNSVDQLLSRLQIRDSRHDQLLDVALVGGVRVGNSWLGRRKYLPHIESTAARLQVTRLAGQPAGPTIAIEKSDILSNETVDGTYQIWVEAGSDSNPGFSCHARFVANAAPHAELGGISLREPLIGEWVRNAEAIPTTLFEGRLDWVEDDLPLKDLLEAVYAAGRSGFAEGELLDLVTRGLVGRINPWALIRSLQESGFVLARQRRLWRGRVWTLAAPRLTLVCDSQARIVVVEGAICAALEREFREVVILAGGRPFRRLGASPWTPALIGAVGVGIDVLTERLHWPISQATVPLMRSPELETSNLAGKHHVLASSWDWDRRRFTTGPVTSSEVSLTRWEHPGGRDHDIYRVQHGGYASSHATRSAGILAAHISARVPLFRAQDGLLSRIGMEGALPLEIARWLRLSALAGGGVLPNEGYGYPTGACDLGILNDALPGCVDGVKQGKPLSAPPDNLLAARRSGGRVRVSWINGAPRVLM